MIRKVTLKFSENCKFLVGLIFTLKNREDKRLNFFLDKDCTPVDCLPDDSVKLTEWLAEEDAFFSLFEGYLTKHSDGAKYIGGMVGYTVKIDLYNKYMHQLEEVNQVDNIE